MSDASLSDASVAAAAASLSDTRDPSTHSSVPPHVIEPPPPLHLAPSHVTRGGPPSRTMSEIDDRDGAVDAEQLAEQQHSALGTGASTAQIDVLVELAPDAPGVALPAGDTLPTSAELAHEPPPRCFEASTARGCARVCCGPCARRPAFFCFPRAACYRSDGSLRALAAYVRKLSGAHVKGPAREPCGMIALLTLGSLVGVMVLWVLHVFVSAPSGFPLMLASLGASSMLTLSVPASPLSQPRNVVGSHVIGAVVGVALRCLFELASAEYRWLAMALAVPVSYALMLVTSTPHPPGGATAIAAAALNVSLERWYGWYFPLMPALVGALWVLGVAVLFNNIPSTRHYPRQWW